MLALPEEDWRYLSHLKTPARERLCWRILNEARMIIARAKEGQYHRAYLDLYQHVQRRDRLIADCFNYWSRSRALEHLLLWRRHGLITEDEFAGFSPETRALVDERLSPRRT